MALSVDHRGFGRVVCPDLAVKPVMNCHACLLAQLSTSMMSYVFDEMGAPQCAVGQRGVGKCERVTELRNTPSRCEYSNIGTRYRKAAAYVCTRFTESDWLC